jgi:gluconate 5-dehydrogenase
LAVYWAEDNVRVNCISPGPFPKTAILEGQPEFIRRLESKSPMRRMGRPDELKGAVVLLASEAGSYITGQNLLVDGGWTAW